MDSDIVDHIAYPQWEIDMKDQARKPWSCTINNFHNLYLQSENKKLYVVIFKETGLVQCARDRGGWVWQHQFSSYVEALRELNTKIKAAIIETELSGMTE